MTEQLHGWLLRFHSLLRRWHLRALVTNEAVRGWRDQLPQSAGRAEEMISVASSRQEVIGRAVACS